MSLRERRFVLEMDARPAVAFKQIYDGQRAYSSLPGVELPPRSKFGMAVLGKFDQTGYMSPRSLTKKNTVVFASLMAKEM